MKKSNLFIAGAPKSGTSFLYQNLQLHPDFFFPKIKELNYFSCQDLIDLNSYYNDYKVSDLKKYLSFFKDAKEKKYLVDASVSYFTFKSIPGRIKEFNPDSKIIFILRDPVKRAFSHYKMDLRMGYATHTFEKYISAPEKYPQHYYQYIENGLYYKHISMYIDAFGSENVCVLVLEEIDKDLNVLYDFLKVNALSEVNIAQKVNYNKKPKNFISKLLQKNRKLTSNLKLVIPKSISNKLNKFLYDKEDPIEMTLIEKEILSAIFQEDVLRLEKLLNRNLTNIWK
jgi:hypothetical protein